jgi:uncharacterized protein with HEPN domain
MTERTLKYLSDILQAIELIEEFSNGVQSFTDYDLDRKTQSSVERQLSIVGEALNNLQKYAPQLEIVHQKQIIGFRNRLVHAYDSIDNSIVWAILVKHIPLLKKEVQGLITDLS